jgi:hypothetical protein
MRYMQTELLRGFEVFSAAQIFRLRKVEADQSNLDASLSGRVEVLEKRLLQIEQTAWRSEVTVDGHSSSKQIALTPSTTYSDTQP